MNTWFSCKLSSVCMFILFSLSDVKLFEFICRGHRFFLVNIFSVFLHLDIYTFYGNIFIETIVQCIVWPTRAYLHVYNLPQLQFIASGFRSQSFDWRTKGMLFSHFNTIGFLFYFSDTIHLHLEFQWNLSFDWWIIFHCFWFWVNSLFFSMKIYINAFSKVFQKC